MTYMDCPRMGGVRLVDWCTHRLTRRALKTRSCWRLHPRKVHAREVFDWWTALVHFWTNSQSLKNKEFFWIDFFSSSFFNKKILVLLSASADIFGVSRMRDFFISSWSFFQREAGRMGGELTKYKLFKSQDSIYQIIVALGLRPQRTFLK